MIETTLNAIYSCNPLPVEIIVHVDNNDTETKSYLERNYPLVVLMFSQERMGPGGGRNLLTEKSQSEIICSFDDDSYPEDADYFEVVHNLFIKNPDASVISSQVYHKNETPPVRGNDLSPAKSFVGCGVSYRKQDFMETEGYLPLGLAYGAEEVDLTLQLMNRNKKIYCSRNLRVFHNTSLSHHESPEVTAASIANISLLAYVRYPLLFLPLTCYQLVSRVFWLIRHNRTEGIGHGLMLSLSLIKKYRKKRSPVSYSVVYDYIVKRDERGQGK